MGLLLVLMSVVIVVAVSKAIASRFEQDPFCVLCSTAYAGLLVASFFLDPAHAGNEFGPLAEIVFFFPLGLGFWIAGAVVLWRAFGQGEPLGASARHASRHRLVLSRAGGGDWLGSRFPSTEYTYNLITELRAPANLPTDPLTRLFVHTDTDRSEDALGRLTKRTEGDSTIFSTTFNLR